MFPVSKHSVHHISILIRLSLELMLQDPHVKGLSQQSIEVLIAT